MTTVIKKVSLLLACRPMEGFIARRTCMTWSGKYLFSSQPGSGQVRGLPTTVVAQQVDRSKVTAVCQLAQVSQIGPIQLYTKSHSSWGNWCANQHIS